MYGQYGPYNTYAGAAPQMQQRLNYLQQQQQQMYQPTMQQPMPMALKGRIVTGMDEAKAAQIDLDGTSTFFPCPAEGKIYEKLIGLDGLPIFRIYEINNSQKQPAYAEQNIVDRLVERVDRLEKQIGFEYHQKLHHSQTSNNIIRQRLWFEYHQKLHHSQTECTSSGLSLVFEYHQKLHHSQTY